MDNPPLDRLLAVLDAAKSLLAQEHVILGSPEALGAWGVLEATVHRYDRHEGSVVVTARPCEYCRCPIFFAQQANGRFLPFETETAPVQAMLPMHRYCVTFDTSPPQVTIRPNLESGEVYVNHIHTCGSSEGPKHKTKALMRRWKANQARLPEVNADLRDKLLAMRAGLGTGPPDAER